MMKLKNNLVLYLNSTKFVLLQRVIILIITHFMQQLCHFATRYNEAINHPYNKSHFSEHILSTGHKYTNIQTTLQILLHKTHKGPKLNTLQLFEIYNHHRTHKNKILNDKITYNYHILDTVITQQNPPSTKLHIPPNPSIPSLKYQKFQHLVGDNSL